MPSFSQVTKSSVFCGIAIALVYFGMSCLAEMPYPTENGVPIPFNPQAFGIAMWSWAIVAGVTGAFLGMEHSPKSAQAKARASYVGRIELFFFVWLTFAGLHVSALAFTAVPGGAVMTVAAFAVAAAILGLWHYERPALAADPAEDLPPQVPPTWSV